MFWFFNLQPCRTSLNVSLELQEVFPLVEKFLPGEKKPPDANPPSKCAKNDRLVQLLIKGVLYESCVAYCQGKATGSQEPRSQVSKG